MLPCATHAGWQWLLDSSIVQCGCQRIHCTREKDRAVIITGSPVHQRALRSLEFRTPEIEPIEQAAAFVSVIRGRCKQLKVRGSR